MDATIQGVLAGVIGIFVMWIYGVPAAAPLVAAMFICFAQKD